MTVVFFALCIWWFQIVIHELGHLLVFRIYGGKKSSRIRLSRRGGRVQLQTQAGWSSPGEGRYIAATWWYLKKKSRVLAAIAAGSTTELFTSAVLFFALRPLEFPFIAQMVVGLSLLNWLLELAVSAILKLKKTPQTSDLLSLIALAPRLSIMWAGSLTLVRGALFIYGMA